MTQEDLFAAASALPEGLNYQADFLTSVQETQLLRFIQALPFREARYKQWDAKRRIVSYGGSYDFTHNELLPAPDVPACLDPLREQICQWSGVAVAELSHAMIAEYRARDSAGLAS